MSKLKFSVAKSVRRIAEDGKSVWSLCFNVLGSKEKREEQKERFLNVDDGSNGVHDPYLQNIDYLEGFDYNIRMID